MGGTVSPQTLSLKGSHMAKIGYNSKGSRGLDRPGLPYLTTEQLAWLAENDIRCGFATDYKTGVRADNEDLVIYSRGVHTVCVNTINRPTVITCTTRRGPTTWVTVSKGEGLKALKPALGWLSRTDASEVIGVDSF